jgi:glycogen synthase
VVDRALRIAIISREYPPDTGFGGMGTFASHLAHGLIELGHEVEVISLQGVAVPRSPIQDKVNNVKSDSKGTAPKESIEFFEDGIRIHRVKPYLREHELGLLGRAVPYMRYVLSATSALWQKFTQLHSEKPFDVVDTPEHLAEGFYVSLSKVAPLVIRLYTPHSKFIDEAFHNVSANFDHQCVATLERAAMVCADALTSPSRDLAEYVAQDINYPLEKISLVYNPIDPTVFCPEGPRAINQSTNGAESELKVVFVGRLEERKGIKYLVHAIPQVVEAVPHAHFYIIGDDTNTAQGQRSALAELQEFIRAKHCEESITFIPRVLLTELPALYRSADVSVVPSVYDNSPYTCLEAMSCGRAVIGTTGGGTKEYLVDGESGVLVAPRDVDALARELIRLLKDPGERERLGKNARLRVLEKFQRKEVARQTTEVYREAIARYHERPPQAFYPNDYETFLARAMEFTEAFNMMLHEELFRWSWRYRIASVMHSIRTRPRFFIAQSVLRLAKRLMPSWSSATTQAPPPLAWLENQVFLKQHQIDEANHLATPGRTAK